MASTSRVTLDQLDRSDGAHQQQQHVLYPPLSFNETIQVITEFIEVAVHTILCVRKIYPQEVFTRKKRYATPVWQARHPGLCEYIANAVKAVKAQMLKEAVHNAVLLITTQSTAEPLERFVFRLDYILPAPDRRDRDIDIQDQLTLPEAELFLRGMMEKIMALDGKLTPYLDPEDVTCAIVIEVQDGKLPQSDDRNEPEQGPWIPLDPRSTVPQRRKAGSATADTRSANAEAEADRHRAYVMPIKTLHTGVINMMFYAEEHVSNKEDHEEQRARAPLASTPAITPQEPPRQSRSRKGRSSGAAALWRDQERDIDEHSREATSDLLHGDNAKKRRKGKSGYGAAMGAGTGGGVQNGADIGDDDDDDDDTSDTESTEEGSGNEMNSVAGIGFGGPAKAQQRPGW